MRVDRAVCRTAAGTHRRGRAGRLHCSGRSLSQDLFQSVLFSTRPLRPIAEDEAVGSSASPDSLAVATLVVSPAPPPCLHQYRGGKSQTRREHDESDRQPDRQDCYRYGHYSRPQASLATGALARPSRTATPTDRRSTLITAARADSPLGVTNGAQPSLGTPREGARCCARSGPPKEGVWTVRLEETTPSASRAVADAGNLTITGPGHRSDGHVRL